MSHCQKHGLYSTKDYGCPGCRIAEIEAQLAEARAVCDSQARLLFWGEALMRSMSGWPATHPNEFTDWKEDWRVVKDQYKALAGEGEQGETEGDDTGRVAE